MKIAFVDGTALIRAHEQDCLFQQDLFQTISRLPLCRLQHSDLQLLSNLLYYGLTTGRGWSTVGEAACGMRLVDLKERDYPQLGKRMAWVLLHCLFPWLGSRLTGWMPNAKWSILGRLTINLITLGIDYGHLAWFYWQTNGAYYEWSKRLLGLRYIRWPPRSPLTMGTGNEPLQRMAALVLLASGSLQALSHLRQAYTDLCSLEVSQEAIECRLCLGSLKGPTVIPCGHVFCWECLGRWLEQQKKCPLCRLSFKPASLFLLQ